jgi:hypothetical protein
MRFCHVVFAMNSISRELYIIKLNLKILRSSSYLAPVPVALRSKACGRSPAEIVGSNPIGAWMFVCCECCVLSGRGLCDELITRPEESY